MSGGGGGGGLYGGGGGALTGGGGGGSSYVDPGALGVTYEDGVSSGDGSLSLSWVLLPPNDDFENAILITGTSGSIEGFNTNATEQDHEPVFDWIFSTSSNVNSVWYRYVPADDGVLELSLQGSPLDSVMVLYKGDVLEELQYVNGSDDSHDVSDTTQWSFQSRFLAVVDAGETYHIQISGYAADENDFTLRWSTTPIRDGDTRARAIALSPVGGSLRGDLRDRAVYDGDGTNLYNTYDVLTGEMQWGSIWYSIDVPMDNIGDYLHITLTGDDSFAPDVTAAYQVLLFKDRPYDSNWLMPCYPGLDADQTAYDSTQLDIYFGGHTEWAFEDTVRYGLDARTYWLRVDVPQYYAPDTFTMTWELFHDETVVPARGDGTNYTTRLARRLDNMPRPRAYGSAVTIGDYVAFIGGETPVGDRSAEVIMEDRFTRPSSATDPGSADTGQEWEVVGASDWGTSYRWSTVDAQYNGGLYMSEGYGPSGAATSFPTNSGDMGHDNTYIWTIDSTTSPDTIRKINPATGAVVSSLTGPADNLTGIDYDESGILVVVSAAKTVYRLNATTGATISSYSLPANCTPRGLASDASGLYQYIASPTNPNGSTYPTIWWFVNDTYFTWFRAWTADPGALTFNDDITTGRFLITDATDGSVHRIDTNSVYLGQIDSTLNASGVVWVEEVWVDGATNSAEFWIADNTAGVLQRYVPPSGTIFMDVEQSDGVLEFSTGYNTHAADTSVYFRYVDANNYWKMSGTGLTKVVDGSSTEPGFFDIGSLNSPSLSNIRSYKIVLDREYIDIWFQGPFEDEETGVDPWHRGAAIFDPAHMEATKFGFYAEDNIARFENISFTSLADRNRAEIAEIDVWDINAQAWLPEAIPALPEARSEPAVVAWVPPIGPETGDTSITPPVIDREPAIYVIGGRFNGVAKDNVWRWTYGASSWEILDPLPTARYGAAAEVIFAKCGYGYTPPVSMQPAADRYLTSLDGWSISGATVTYNDDVGPFDSAEGYRVIELTATGTTITLTGGINGRWPITQFEDALFRFMWMPDARNYQNPSQGYAQVRTTMRYYNAAGTLIGSSSTEAQNSSEGGETIGFWVESEPFNFSPSPSATASVRVELSFRGGPYTYDLHAGDKFYLFAPMMDVVANENLISDCHAIVVAGGSTGDEVRTHKIEALRIGWGFAQAPYADELTDTWVTLADHVNPQVGWRWVRGGKWFSNPYTGTLYGGRHSRRAWGFLSFYRTLHPIDEGDPFVRIDTEHANNVVGGFDSGVAMTYQASGSTSATEALFGGDFIDPGRRSSNYSNGSNHSTVWYEVPGRKGAAGDVILVGGSEPGGDALTAGVNCGYYVAGGGFRANGEILDDFWFLYMDEPGTFRMPAAGNARLRVRKRASSPINEFYVVAPVAQIITPGVDWTDVELGPLRPGTLIAWDALVNGALGMTRKELCVDENGNSAGHYWPHEEGGVYEYRYPRQELSYSSTGWGWDDLVVRVEWEYAGVVYPTSAVNGSIALRSSDARLRKTSETNVIRMTVDAPAVSNSLETLSISGPWSPLRWEGEGGA